jgi:hypothetical protein
MVGGTTPRPLIFRLKAEATSEPTRESDLLGPRTSDLGKYLQML